MPRNSSQGNQKRDSEGQFTSSGRGGSQSGSKSGGKSGGSRTEAAGKGGEAVSNDREKMAEMGRKGGRK